MKLSNVSSILFLTFSIAFSDSSFSNCLKKSKYSTTCLCFLKQKGLVKGNFHDVGAESNGALIYQARKVSFVGGLYNKDPLRPEIHIQATNGYTSQNLYAYFQIDLFQAYLINTLKVWVYDHHTFIRTFNIQVYIEDTLKNRVLVYDSTIATGLVTIKFDETIVQSVIVYNRGGNSLNQYLHIIRFQAYYAF